MKLRHFLGLAALSTMAFASESFFVSDPFFSKQWALKNSGQVFYQNISDLGRMRVQGIAGVDINWMDTSAVNTPKKDLIVAVLDSGVDIDHPDLAGRIWYNEKLCTNAPNAKNLPCNGFNFLDGNTDLSDDVGHGTHVAGAIAANRNNLGIAGAADPRIKIMPVKFVNSKVTGFSYNGKLITDVVADAMIFAIKNGAEVINLSLGWPSIIDTPRVRAAFQMAEEQNVVVVAASGNNTKDLPLFPCSYENVICVGAIDNRGDLTSFSNYGSKVDMAAPGEYIVSTIPRNLESRALRIANYDVKRGSSQAAPFVTAAVANLKLLNPGLTNDKVRSLLFRSAKPMSKSKYANRFIKHGVLDMKKLLSMASEEESQAFLNPQVKSITEVRFKAKSKQFNFNLPLKNLSDVDFNGSVCVSSEAEAIAIDQNCFDVNGLLGHTSTVIAITGSLIDLSKDSHLLLNIQIGQKKYQTSLVFSRDLNDDENVINSQVNNGNFDDMAIISGSRKLSKMARVNDKFHRINFPEYFFLERTKQTPTSTVISLLTNVNGAYTVKYISLPLVSRIVSIHRQDINLDGSLDYFIYAMSANKDELLFFSLDKNFNPLFGAYSKWAMAISTFEGLPVDGGVEKFEWLKMNHSQFGNILVPSIYRSYAMPEADNSKNILDRITSANFHQFYLSPTLQKSDNSMRIDLRVIDSVEVMKKMRAEFHLYEDQSISLLHPFPQTQEQSARGEIHSLARMGGVTGSFVELIMGQTEIKTKPLTNVLGLESSLIYPIMSSDKGILTNESILTSLLNRSSAEFIVKSNDGVTVPMVLKQDWENPIMGLIGGFSTNGKKSLFVENRATVSFLNGDGEHFDLPIYRDSSFPGVNFSETFSPILSQGRPGIFLNSTAIYGERLYSMIGTENGLVRPLYLSVDIPAGCVPLNPEILEGKTTYHYVFLCGDQNKQVSLKFLPMSEL